ncbi:Vgb family protein [Novosphingobium sp.]|jgi:DNA-binding beta-propeller fold protein YncE|uniref:Vgb family protein n=1 Tax=Novosphingobium sp. TaxID=1874826 RepID=UPI002FE010A1
MRKFVTMLLAASATLPSLAHAEQVIQVPGFADFLAVDGDTVWVTNKGRVEQWSRHGGKGRKLAEVAMAHPCGAMAIASGSLWVADCDEKAVKRIDVKTAKLVATIATGIASSGELNVVAGDGSVWVASDNGADDRGGLVARIDPAKNAVLASVPVDRGTWYLTYGFGAVWAVSAATQSLQRIDTATNTVTATIPLGKEPGFLIAGEGGVWVQEQGDGTVARIDPATNVLAGRVKVGDNLKWGDIDTGAGKVWLRTTDDQVFAVIDPVTMTVEARKGKAAGSGALRWTPKGIWTSAHDEHTLSWWSRSELKSGR